MTDCSHVAVGFALLAVVSAGGVAVPADGATPADATTRIDTCTTITQPGHYELASDLDGDPASERRACVTIRSGNVTLDGDGHTVGEADTAAVFVGTATPYSDAAEYLPNVTVRDVVVTGDVDLYRAPDATVRNVRTRTVDTASVSLSESNGSLVANSTLSGTDARGASVHLFRSHDTTIANNTVTNTDAHDRGSAIGVWYTDDATVRDNDVRSSYVGIELHSANHSVVSDNTVAGSEEAAVLLSLGSRGNLVSTTTVGAGDSGAGDATALDMQDAGPNRVERLRVGSDTTVSLSGRNVVVRDVDAPPAVPSDLAAVGGFVDVTRYRGANVSLAMHYDESAVEAAGLNESALRLYRHPAEASPSHVYAPMGTASTTDSAADWEPVPGLNRVNTSANRVFAGVPEFAFGGPNTPADARRIEVGETVNGTITSDEFDWYAFEAAAGEAIIPRLEARGPLNGTLRFGIYGPNGSDISVYANEAPLSYYYTVGEFGAGREARGAAVAPTNGTYYVRVSPGGVFGDPGQGPYALSVETEPIDAFEPNQRRGTATRVEPNATLTATTAGYDTDWYALRATGGSSIDVTAALGNTTNATLSIALLGPDGEELDTVEHWSRYSQERATLDATASQDGTYYVRIRQAPASLELFGQGPYDLTATVSPCPNATTDGAARR